MPAGTPKREPAAQMRMSHALAITMPPPMQNPLIMAITGFGASTSEAVAAVTAAVKMWLAVELCRASSNSAMSAPEMKALSPAPRTTMARTAGIAGQSSDGLRQSLPHVQPDGVEPFRLVEGQPADRPLHACHQPALGKLHDGLHGLPFGACCVDPRGQAGYENPWKSAMPDA